MLHKRASIRNWLGVFCVVAVVFGAVSLALPAGVEASWFLSRYVDGDRQNADEGGARVSSPLQYYGGFARRWLQPDARSGPRDGGNAGSGDNTPSEDVGQTPGADQGAGSGTVALESDERLLFEMMNEERTKNGLPPYQLDERLTGLARMKSEDLVKNHYFSHVSPTYGSPYEMLDDAGVDYVRAGENIAQAGNVYVVHYRLMNSSGHRRNILHQYFTHVGIGVVRNGSGVMVTELFIQKP